MDTYMHKSMASIASLEKIEIIRSQEFMPSEAKLKFKKKMIILRPKTAILGPQFCRILVLGPHFWWSEGLGPRETPLDPPLVQSGADPGFDQGGPQIVTGLNCQWCAAASCERSEPFSAWGLGLALGPQKFWVFHY